MGTSSTSYVAPRGMRDFYPEDMVLRTRLFDTWRATATAFGFVPYDACVVESLDLLKRKAGEEIVEQIYHFQDKSGRDLALRPEMTPTLARMVAARSGALSFPLKWSTIAQCFRYERTTRGRKREHYQWNLDILGEESVSAEAEIIAAAATSLAALGLGPDDVRIHISNRALLSELLESLGIPPSHHAGTFLALDKRGKLPDDKIRDLLAAEGMDESAIGRVWDLLGVQSLEDAAALVGSDSPALKDIHDLLELLDVYGVREQVRFDIAVVRGLAYYTGIVFEGFDARGELRAIFGGGRYNNLLGDLGSRPIPGVGLGFGDVVIAELLAEKGLADQVDTGERMTVGYMEAAQRLTAQRVAHAYRQRGRQVDMGLHAEKAKTFFSRAGKGGFSHAVYVGPDDVATQSIRLKNLATREQEDIALADL